MEQRLSLITLGVADVGEAVGFYERLGWSPAYSNVRMTTEAYDWYCRNFEKVRAEPGIVLRLLNALS